MAQPVPWTFLTRRRIRAGLSKQSLATAVGVGVPHIYRIEAGERRASPELLKRLATVLDTDVDDLYDTSPEPPPQTSRQAVAS
jgi:transcriptional regulator with XRE-family HTH domain